VFILPLIRIYLLWTLYDLFYVCRVLSYKLSFMILLINYWMYYWTANGPVILRISSTSQFQRSLALVPILFRLNGLFISFFICIWLKFWNFPIECYCYYIFFKVFWINKCVLVKNLVWINGLDYLIWSFRTTNASVRCREILLDLIFVFPLDESVLVLIGNFFKGSYQCSEIFRNELVNVLIEFLFIL